MGALSKVFGMASSVVEQAPQAIGLAAVFYFVATTLVEVSTTGVPFWSALWANAQGGVNAVIGVGSELLQP